MDDVQNNNTQLDDLRNELKSLFNECETLYSTYDERRSKVGSKFFISSIAISLLFRVS